MTRVTPQKMVGWLPALGEAASRGAMENPWGRGIALGRTLLAVAMAGTLLLTPASALFSPAAGVPAGPRCDDVGKMSLFCLGGATHPQLRVVLAGIICLIVVTGWRPRVTGIAVCWVALSVFTSVTLQDGGDQVALVLGLLLLPVCLTDSRRWQWSKLPDRIDHVTFQRLVAHWGLILVRVQVGVIYLDACLAKLGVTQWANGTALYYIFRNHMFGVPAFARPAEAAVLSHPLIVAPFTWSVLLLEGSPGLAYLYPRFMRRPLFFAGVTMHIGIMLLMGLVSFGMTMIGALCIYLLVDTRPAESADVSHAGHLAGITSDGLAPVPVGAAAPSVSEEDRTLIGDRG